MTDNISSRKHAYTILNPLKPHFYIVKLGFTGVYIIFLISSKNIDCGYSLEPPRRGGSNEYTQSMFWAEIWKILEFFLSENFKFLEVKFSIYLKRRVYVMVLVLRIHYSSLNTQLQTYVCSAIQYRPRTTVILSLPLIQKGQLSVSGDRMCTILVNRLEDEACPVNVWLGKLTALDMNPLGWLGR